MVRNGMLSRDGTAPVLYNRCIPHLLAEGNHANSVPAPLSAAFIRSVSMPDNSTVSRNSR